LTLLFVEAGQNHLLAFLEAPLAGLAGSLGLAFCRSLTHGEHQVSLLLMTDTDLRITRRAEQPREGPVHVGHGMNRRASA